MTTPEPRSAAPARGPYETSYEVLRGYDAPAPAPAPEAPADVTLLRGREPRRSRPAR